MEGRAVCGFAQFIIDLPILSLGLMSNQPSKNRRRKEQNMTPEEIVSDLNSRNRELLYACEDYCHLTHEQVLALMDNAAMQGFRMGSNVALSMVKGSLLVQLTRASGTKRDVPGV